MREGVPLSGVQYGAFPLNEPVEGYGVSRVLKSRNPKYPAGTIVSSIMTAWSDYQVLTGERVDQLEVYRMIVGCPDDGKGGDGNVSSGSLRVPRFELLDHVIQQLTFHFVPPGPIIVLRWPSRLPRSHCVCRLVPPFPTRAATWRNPFCFRGSRSRRPMRPNTLQDARPEPPRRRIRRNRGQMRLPPETRDRRRVQLQNHAYSYRAQTALPQRHRLLFR